MKKSVSFLTYGVVPAIVLSLALSIVFILNKKTEFASIWLIAFLVSVSIIAIVGVVFSAIVLYLSIKKDGLKTVAGKMLVNFVIYFIGFLLLNRLFDKHWAIWEASIAGILLSMFIFATEKVCKKR